FFQAEDGIRDFHVTGVQTCALPIWSRRRARAAGLQRLGNGARLRRAGTAALRAAVRRATTPPRTADQHFLQTEREGPRGGTYRVCGRGFTGPDGAAHVPSEHANAIASGDETGGARRAARRGLANASGGGLATARSGARPSPRSAHGRRRSAGGAPDPALQVLGIRSRVSSAHPPTRPPAPSHEP